MSDVTRILSQIEYGDPSAADLLLPLVYDELRKLAARRLELEKPGQTLQATGLVHEAYVRLVDDGESKSWNSRRHFFAAAAEAMRRILIEQARKKGRQKHGGDHRRISVENLDMYHKDQPVDFLALDDALNRLASKQPDVFEVVKLRFFVGLTIEQVADTLEVSVRTVNNHWAYAKAWLFRELNS
jgi:RNA polymerase sigma factor (TIGR02999 family)